MRNLRRRARGVEPRLVVDAGSVDDAAMDASPLVIVRSWSVEMSRTLTVKMLSEDGVSGLGNEFEAGSRRGRWSPSCVELIGM